MVEIYIDEVYPKGETYPFLTYFQNGYATDDFVEEKCVVLEDVKTGKKRVVTELNSIIYEGEESEEQLGKTFALVRNRKTGKSRLVEVGTVELKPFQPMGESLVLKELEASYVDLGRKFGSKRHKQMLEQNEKLKVNESVVMEQLQNVSQNVSVESLDLSSYNQADSGEFYIPPIDREASNISDVYRLNSILTPEQYDEIFSELDKHDYKQDLHPCVKEVFSDKWTKEQTVLAYYASVLLTSYCKTVKELRDKNYNMCPFSATLDKIIQNEFFIYNTHFKLRPAHYKDKAICYAIVFLFLINNYKIDVGSLSKHVKIVERTTYLKINMTGGWPLKQGTKKLAVLKLPLNKAVSYKRKK